MPRRHLLPLLATLGILQVTPWRRFPEPLTRIQTPAPSNAVKPPARATLHGPRRESPALESS